jgi:exodeoxyribonuclease VII large subunit
MFVLSTNMSETRQIFSLKQVATSIRKTIEERYQQVYWVKAEMHKLNLFPSGHAFPELVQKENDKIVAQLSGSIWSHNYQRINKQFVEKVKEPLKEGTTILMQVKISFSETYGLSLQILDIDPSYSLGELQREREETLKKLEAEGLINRNQRLEFPLLPQRIAIISADTSKGLSDFKMVLENNPWGYCFFTMLFPAYLQGDVAVTSIKEQLARIEKVKHHFDVVIIVRGGGGEVGLSCYNHFDLCKAIATFPLPVLTGIGHSTNMTVAELVAFRNAITPTELADFFLQTFHDFSVPVLDAGRSLRIFSSRLLTLRSQEFTSETKHFKNAASLFLNQAHHDLRHLGQVCKTESRTILNRNSEWLNFHKSNLNQGLKRVHQENERKLDDIRKLVIHWSQKTIETEHLYILQQENVLRLVDPKNVLKRGYSITTVNGKTIQADTHLTAGDIIQTKTLDFEIESIIQNIQTHE